MKNNFENFEEIIFSLKFHLLELFKESYYNLT